MYYTPTTLTSQRASYPLAQLYWARIIAEENGESVVGRARDDVAREDGGVDDDDDFGASRGLGAVVASRLRPVPGGPHSRRRGETHVRLPSLRRRRRPGRFGSRVVGRCNRRGNRAQNSNVDGVLPSMPRDGRLQRVVRMGRTIKNDLLYSYR